MTKQSAGSSQISAKCTKAQHRYPGCSLRQWISSKASLPPRWRQAEVADACGGAWWTRCVSVHVFGFTNCSRCRLTVWLSGPVSRGALQSYMGKQANWAQEFLLIIGSECIELNKGRGWICNTLTVLESLKATSFCGDVTPVHAGEMCWDKSPAAQLLQATHGTPGPCRSPKLHGHYLTKPQTFSVPFLFHWSLVAMWPSNTLTAILFWALSSSKLCIIKLNKGQSIYTLSENERRES